MIVVFFLYLTYTVGSFLVILDLVLFLPIALKCFTNNNKKKVYMKLLCELSLIGWSFHLRNLPLLIHPQFTGLGPLTPSRSFALLFCLRVFFRLGSPWKWRESS